MHRTSDSADASQKPGLSKLMADGSPWPRLSIVTPSYNQCEFLEATIQSVLGQGYPNLEYIVVDGGSTDGSVDILRRYEDQLAYWISEPDGGQYDAINKGFTQSSGEIMAWINSDDLYFPWTFWIVAEIFRSLPNVQWLTSVALAYWDQLGRVVTCSLGEGYNRAAFYRGRNAALSPFHTYYIQQEATFWRRGLWQQVGEYVDARLQLAGDFELWARFWEHADLYSTTALLSGFRIHGRQKTASGMDQYREEARQVLRATCGKVPGQLEGQMLRLLRLLPHLRRWMGWQARFVYYDHSANRWLERTDRFV